MEQDLQALEQKRKDVADLRHIRITKRRPFMVDHLERLAFIEETSVKTNMARTTGRPPRGQRLVDHAPFGRRHPQTFIRALRHDRSDAPWVIDGAMNGRMVGFYIKTQPVPTLRPGDAVIPDNRSGHKSPGGAQTVQDIAARLPLLPPYSPDLDPMEMAFSNLKTVIRKAVARTCDQLWQAVGHVRDLFSEEECCNCLIVNGYEANQPQHALVIPVMMREARQGGRELTRK